MSTHGPVDRKTVRWDDSKNVIHEIVPSYAYDSEEGDDDQWHRPKEWPEKPWTLSGLSSLALLLSDGGVLETKGAYKPLLVAMALYELIVLKYVTVQKAYVMAPKGKGEMETFVLRLPVLPVPGKGIPLDPDSAIVGVLEVLEEIDKKKWLSQAPQERSSAKVALPVDEIIKKLKKSISRAVTKELVAHRICTSSVSFLGRKQRPKLTSAGEKARNELIKWLALCDVELEPAESDHTWIPNQSAWEFTHDASTVLLLHQRVVTRAADMDREFQTDVKEQRFCQKDRLPESFSYMWCYHLINGLLFGSSIAKWPSQRILQSYALFLCSGHNRASQEMFLNTYGFNLSSTSSSTHPPPQNTTSQSKQPPPAINSLSATHMAHNNKRSTNNGLLTIGDGVTGESYVQSKSDGNGGVNRSYENPTTPPSISSVSPSSSTDSSPMSLSTASSRLKVPPGYSGSKNRSANWVALEEPPSAKV